MVTPHLLLLSQGNKRAAGVIRGAKANHSFSHAIASGDNPHLKSFARCPQFCVGDYNQAVRRAITFLWFRLVPLPGGLVHLPELSLDIFVSLSKITSAAGNSIHQPSLCFSLGFVAIQCKTKFVLDPTQGLSLLECETLIIRHAPTVRSIRNQIPTKPMTSPVTSGNIYYNLIMV